MQIVDVRTLKKIKQRNTFFDFKNLCCKFGYCIKIECRGDIISYSDIRLGADESLYKSIENTLISLFIDILNTVDLDSGVISRYNEKWIVNKSISLSLYNRFVELGIKNTFGGGFYMDDMTFNCDILKAAFRYNCFPLFISDNLIIAPSDHMEIFVWTSNNTLKESIELLVSQNKQLSLDQKTIKSGN